MGRPTDIPLFHIKFPVTAIVSITHRITGVILFFSILPELGLLTLALSSPEGFEQAVNIFHHPLVMVMVAGIAFSLNFHALAGIRHIIQDIGFLEDLKGARVSAFTTWVLAFLSTIGLLITLYSL